MDVYKFYIELLTLNDVTKKFNFFKTKIGAKNLYLSKTEFIAR